MLARVYFLEHTEIPEYNRYSCYILLHRLSMLILDASLSSSDSRSSKGKSRCSRAAPLTKVSVHSPSTWLRWQAAFEFDDPIGRGYIMPICDGTPRVKRLRENPVQKRDSLYCVPVTFLWFAMTDNESSSNAEINVSRTRQANGHDEYSKAIVHKTKGCIITDVIDKLD